MNLNPTEIHDATNTENSSVKGITRCGFVAIVGRPNVGKSSLLNALLKKKVSITTYKPQTTRHQILGIKTNQNTQTVYVDTPGIHLGGKKALNKQMNKVARSAFIDVNAILFVVEALKWTAEDALVADLVSQQDAPVMVVVNKVDLIEQKERLLPFLQELYTRLPQATVVPVSAKKKIQLDVIESWIDPKLPEGPFYFLPEQVVNHSDKFHVAEIVREKLILFLQNEIPYSLTVDIEKMEEDDKIKRIEAAIWIERESQKSIVIGEKGAKLKEVGTCARQELERHYGKKVFLRLWVRVKDGWSDDTRLLKSLGYEIGT